MRRLPVLSALLLACAAMPVQAATPPHYKVTQLNALPGGGQNWVIAVNSAGQSVGAAYDDQGTMRAVSWNSDGSIAAISPDYGQAWGINDAGTTAGFTITGASQFATLWSGGTMQQLPSPNAEIFEAISSNGHSAGQNSGADIYGSYNHAIYYDGTMHDIGALNDGFANAQGINDSDQVVGYSTLSRWDFTNHAFFYSNGVMTDMGTLGGAESQAYGLNNGGTAVGTADTADGTYHAFSYTGGVMTDLGGLQGNVNSDAIGINDLGQIVGDSQVDGGPRAVLWQDGQAYDLNGLLDSTGAGWQLQYGAAISSNGLIVGLGTFNGVQSTFLLQAVPAPEPASWALMLTGFGTVGASLRMGRRQTAAA